MSSIFVLTNSLVWFLLLLIGYEFELVLSAEYTWTFLNKLPLGEGPVDIESIEYDPVRKQWLIASWFTGEVYSFPSDIVYMDYNASDLSTYFQASFGDQLFWVNGWRNLHINSTFNNTDQSLSPYVWRPAGMEVVNNKLYVVDFYFGRVSSWNLDTKELDGNTFINNKAGYGAQLDGLCHDQNNPEYLYITDFGATVTANGSFVSTGNEAVYRLNTNDWSVETLYDSSTVIEDIEIGTYTIQPNGCVIVDDIFYAVNYKIEEGIIGAFVSYNITANGPWKVDSDILPTNGDGLIYVDDLNTFFTDDLINGTLLSYSPDKDDKFTVITDQQYMHDPADMAYNPDDQIIALVELYTGYVVFIQLDIITTTQYYSTMSEDDGDSANRLAFNVACAISIITFKLFM